MRPAEAAPKVWLTSPVFFLLFAFHFIQLTDVTIGLKSKKIKWEESNISSVGKIIFILFLFPVDINHKIITYLKKYFAKNLKNYIQEHLQ